MRIPILGLATALAVSTPALAGPLSVDPRLETAEWRDGAIIPLRTTAGGHVTLMFAPGEAVRTVLVGDPGAIEVKVAPQADSIALLTSRQPGDASIRVETQLRSYRFSLSVGPANDVAYLVRFSFPVPNQAVPSAQLPPPEATASYTLQGKTELRPLKVSDDGAKTYIEWGEDQPLPAVFALNALGGEETVDSYMRGGVMVIDRIYPRLIFRIGKLKAQANRLPPRKEDRP